jgi:hypothetical protein
MYETSSNRPNYFFLILGVFIGVVLIYNNFYEKPIVKTEQVVQQESNITSEDSKAFVSNILEIDLNNKRAFNVSVRLNEKCSESHLITLALQVKNRINAVSDKGVVFFFLPDMKLNNGAWAAVDFEPNINVRIIGQSLEVEKEVTKGVETIKDYYGLWVDDNSKEDLIIRIRKDRTLGYVFEYITVDDQSPSELPIELSKVKFNGKVAFKDKDHPGQYFIVESNGDLSVYDNAGFVVRYRRLK